MRLELDDGTVLEDPSDSDIARALASTARGDNSFAILSHSEMTYLQACEGSRPGLVLEYQEGSLTEHYRSIDEAIPLEQVTRTFQKYAKSDESWLDAATWRRC